MSKSQSQNDAVRDADEPDTAAEPMERLNAIALRDGWRRAIDEVFGADPGTIRYVTDPDRSRFVDLLPLSSESTVLEIGSSLGQITCALAERAGRVHGLELDPSQARFAATRCLQEGHSKVSIVAGGGDCQLTEEDDSFDGVVINLVLEWCGESNPALSHLQLQRRMLGEAARVLKPGGWLYLSTKNRFGLGYLTGKMDEHSYNIRFGQALPRGLLAILLRFRGRSRTRGLIHSYGALHRLLTEAGFSQLQPFWAVPEYRFPTEIVRADATSIREARRRAGFVQGQFRSTRILMSLVPAPLVKYVMPGLIFLARKAP